MTPPTAVPPVPGVGAVLALKAGELVKSRLAPLPGPLRLRLAWTMAVDTLAALRAALAGPDGVLVVSDQPHLQARLDRAGLAGVRVLAEGRPRGTNLGMNPGMNGALSRGADVLRGEGLDRVLACVGDLPALRPGSVASVLAGAAAYPRAYLPDATGIGTTMLHASADQALQPRFQGRSAAAHHSSGAVALTDERLPRPVPEARRDVDTEVDLADAAGLGVGSATAALLDPGTGLLGTYAVVTTTTIGAPDGRAVTSAGVGVDLADDRLAEGLRIPRPGQRLHAVLSGTTVLSAWL